MLHDLAVWFVILSGLVALSYECWCLGRASAVKEIDAREARHQIERDMDARRRMAEGAFYKGKGR